MTTVYIETARLILRTVTLDDVEEVALAGGVKPGRPADLSRRSYRPGAADAGQPRAQRGPAGWCICAWRSSRETGRISGWYGLDQRDASKAQPVLFYLLKAAHWGQGLATEVARAVLVCAALLGWLLRGWHVKEARRG